jgi:hypothetical protein
MSTTAATGRALRIRGNAYPLVLPKLSDPRLHLSTTFVFLYLLGEFEFHFRLSIPQILTSLLTCAVIEFAVTFWQKRVILWPASALLTGNGTATGGAPAACGSMPPSARCRCCRST